MHIHWSKTFRILVIPEAIFQARGVKFSSVGALNTPINISSGFCEQSLWCYTEGVRSTNSFDII